MSEAYRSALELGFDVRAGLVMRQIHHWAALLFLAAITVHLARVFFTETFRRPREINWIIGCTLLPLALFNGLFGYSLLDDQLSGTGLRIVYGITISIRWWAPGPRRCCSAASSPARTSSSGCTSSTSC